MLSVTSFFTNLSWFCFFLEEFITPGFCLWEETEVLYMHFDILWLSSSLQTWICNTWALLFVCRGKASWRVLVTAKWLTFSNLFCLWVLFLKSSTREIVRWIFWGFLGCGFFQSHFKLGIKVGNICPVFKSCAFLFPSSPSLQLGKSLSWKMWRWNTESYLGLLSLSNCVSIFT